MHRWPLQELLYTRSCSIVFSFAGPGEYESSAFMGKAKMGMICSKDGRFKPVKSLVPGPGAYAVSQCVHVCALYFYDSLYVDLYIIL